MAVYSAWAAGTEDNIRNFPLLPFGVPIVPMVLVVGGTYVWYDGRPIIGL